MITWVVDKQVAIGNSTDARKATQDDFDVSICVAIDLDICDNVDEVRRSIYPRRHKVGLYDGPGNHALTFYAAILLIQSYFKQERRILVHCHAGASRSVMVTAAWMTYAGLTPDVETALAQIMPPRDLTIYRKDLLAVAKGALQYGIQT